VLYKFRLTGATLGEAIQTIWAPKDMPLKDLRIFVMRQYNLDPDLMSVNFIIGGVKMIKTSEEIEGYAITPDSTVDDIKTMVGAITIMVEQIGRADIDNQPEYKKFRKNVQSLFGGDTKMINAIFSSTNTRNALDFLARFNSFINERFDSIITINLVLKGWHQMFDNKYKDTRLSKDQLDVIWKLNIEDHIPIGKGTIKQNRDFVNAIKSAYEIAVMKEIIKIFENKGNEYGTYQPTNDINNIFDQLNDILTNDQKKRHLGVVRK